MLKLSRRNWNNVLIFVVLLLMFSLYDWTGKSGDPMSGSLLAESDTLLSISVGEYRLVQQNTQWQLLPHAHPSVTASEMFHAWQYTSLPLLQSGQAPQQAPVAQAMVQLVGEVMPQIWLLYPEPPHYVLQQAGELQFYLLTSQQARLLFLLE